jgi:aspartokinase
MQGAPVTKYKIGGLVENPDLTMFHLTAVEDQPGAAGEVLNAFAEKQVNLEYITETSTTDGLAVMGICVNRAMASRIDAYLAGNAGIRKKLNITRIENVSVLGIYGPHFREKPNLAARFCQILGNSGVNILGLSSSISSICAVIRDDEIAKARSALLEVFELP